MRSQKSESRALVAFSIARCPGDTLPKLLRITQGGKVLLRERQDGAPGVLPPPPERRMVAEYELKNTIADTEVGGFLRSSSQRSPGRNSLPRTARGATSQRP